MVEPSAVAFFPATKLVQASAVAIVAAATAAAIEVLMKMLLMFIYILCFVTNLTIRRNAIFAKNPDICKSAGSYARYFVSTASDITAPDITCEITVRSNVLCGAAIAGRKM